MAVREEVGLAEVGRQDLSVRYFVTSRAIAYLWLVWWASATVNELVVDLALMVLVIHRLRSRNKSDPLRRQRRL